MNVRTTNATTNSDRLRLPMLCGADVELGNFILGVKRRNGTGDVASQALLSEIEGLPRGGRSQTMQCDCAECRAAIDSDRDGQRGGRAIFKRTDSGIRFRGFNPQDRDRRYLPANGSCAYIDLDHLELCLPEVVSAYDHVACWHAMLRIAQNAMAKANEGLVDGKRIQVLVNNTDGKGNSYGSHLNFLVTRRTWNNIFLRKIHYMLYLASFQVSSIVITGQGKVGSENGAEPVAFQLSQRADFFEALMGPQTTYARPIVNSRDEPLCGRRAMRREDETDAMARLHVIFFDNTLSHVASLLKVGMMQIVLAMIEAEHVNADLILDDPVETVVSWSHDVSLQARARLANGDEVSAVELQLRFLEEAKRFIAAGGCEGIVPRADEIVALWEDTLLKLQSGDLAALASRLDWVLKFSLLQQVIGKRADLAWDSPQIKHLDHMYSSLDTSEGLYWAYQRSGFIERIASDEQIEHFVHNAPEDTRAWTRAALLSSVEPEVIDEVNWDFIRFRYRNESFRMIKRTLDLASPLGFTREDVEQIFLEAESLAELLDALGAPKEDESLAKVKGSWRGPGNASLGGLMDLWGKELTTSRAGTISDEDLELES